MYLVMFCNCYGINEYYFFFIVIIIKSRIAWMDYKDGRKVVVVDFFGLIEGVWDNVGMGYRFLKYIERIKFFFFLVDINGF